MSETTYQRSSVKVPGVVCRCGHTGEAHEAVTALCPSRCFDCGCADWTGKPAPDPPTIRCEGTDFCDHKPVPEQPQEAALANERLSRRKEAARAEK
jgi:hypothetical protein